MERGRRIQNVVALVEAQGHACALVGGVAVSLRARERFTRDIDFAVAVKSDAEAEAVGLAFQAAGYELLQVFEQTEKGLISTLRFLVPGGSRTEPELDLMFASSGIEAEIVEAAERLAILPGVEVRVARLHHLIAMKVLSESDVREQDRADLLALIAVASKRDLELGRKAVRLIGARGFARRKNLLARLESFVERRKP